MNFFQFIVQDWEANKNNSKGRLILVLFRIANFCTTHKIYRYMGFPYLIIYRLSIEWILGIEIPWNVKIGKGLALYHGQSLVVNKNVVMGNNCTLRHCTTIGNKELKDGRLGASPVIGDNVDIGSNVCIIGDIFIKDNVKIGCGAVVTKNISGNCIVVGNPAVERKYVDEKLVRMPV